MSKLPFLMTNGKPLLLASGKILQSTSVTSSQSLSSIVGPVPASLNMLPWTSDAQYTDFTWSNTGALGSGYYTSSTASVSGGVASLDGGATAQHLAESSGGGTHWVAAQIPAGTMTPIRYRFATIAKAAERTRLVMSLYRYEDSTNGVVSACLDLASGVFADTSAGSNMTIVAHTATSLGSGWYLFTLDFHYITVNDGSAVTWISQLFIDSGSGNAARSTSYSGDGSSGVNLWWLNLMPLRAWDLSTLAFSDDFDSLDTIDVNNTGAPGFNWYVRNRAANGIPIHWWTGQIPTPSTNLSISSPSVLKIYDPNSNEPNDWMSMIWSVYCPDAGGYYGNAFQGPVVFDGKFSWDGSLHGSFSLGPAFWGSSMEALTNSGMTNSHFLELDTADLGGTSWAATDWDDSTGTPSANVLGAPLSLNSKMTEGAFKRFSSLWLTIASGSSGWGLFMPFFDGQYVAYQDKAYSATDKPQGGATTTVGVMAENDSHHLPIFLNTATNTTANAGGGWPMYIDWVKVYTA